MDRSERLLDELKIAEARSEGARAWTETGRRVRREVRRLRSAWETERAARFSRDVDDDGLAERDSG